MKTFIIASVLTLTSASARAQFISPGNKPNQTIEDLKKSVVNMIKNEKMQPGKKSNNSTINDISDEDLENAVQIRLQEVGELINLRDHKTFDDALTFTSLAYKAWNPDLRNVDLKKQFKQNIAQFGFVEGYITPVMALMDLSYASDVQQFGILMNVMLNDVSPSMAQGFKNQFGIPTEFSNLNFTMIRNQGRDGMWSVLMSGLNPDFFKAHHTTKIPSNINETINPLMQQFPSMDTFLDNTLKSSNTYLTSYLKKTGQEGNSDKFMKNREKMKGAFSGVIEKDPVSCQQKCYQDIRNVAFVTVPAMAAVGGKIGTLAGPKGTGVGYLVGGAIGFGTAAYVGYNECMSGTQCGGEASEKEKAQARENEAKAQTAEAIAKESQAKAKEAQVRVKEAEARVKEAEARVKEAEAKSKEAEARVKEAEAKAKEATAKAKLAEENIKAAIDKKSAEEKAAKAQKEKEDADKKLAQAKKDQEKAEEQEKKEKEESEKEKNKFEEEQKMTEIKDDKQMIENDEKGNKLTQDEIKERKEKYNSTPAVPPEDGSVKSSLQKNYDLITKKFDKDSNAKPTKVNTIYPSNPNAGN